MPLPPALVGVGGFSAERCLRQSPCGRCSGPPSDPGEGAAAHRVAPEHVGHSAAACEPCNSCCWLACDSCCPEPRLNWGSVLAFAEAELARVGSISGTWLALRLLLAYAFLSGGLRLQVVVGDAPRPAGDRADRARAIARAFGQ